MFYQSVHIILLQHHLHGCHLMSTKIVTAGLCLIFMGMLTSCTIRSTSPTTTEIYSRPYTVNYQPNPNDTDFHHDSLVGYGGVNVYDYNEPI